MNIRRGLGEDWYSDQIWTYGGESANEKSCRDACKVLVKGAKGINQKVWSPSEDQYCAIKDEQGIYINNGKSKMVPDVNPITTVQKMIR